MTNQYGDLTTMILKALLYHTMSYKQVEEMIKDLRGVRYTNPASIRVTLSRLKKKGLVTRTTTGWRATTEAKDLTEPKMNLSYYEKPRPTKKHSDQQVIVIYDIPEHLKTVRNWLRLELELLGFKMEQRSVWIGPAPLPQEFIDTLKRLDVIKYIRFLPVGKDDLI